MVDAANDLDAPKSGILTFMDDILRNREEHFNSIFDNRDVPRQILWMLGIIVALSALYGLVMGTLSGIPAGIPQMISSAIKVPVLYLLTLFVCYPVLFVVNVVMGSKLGFTQTLALILLALALNAILLGSCAPIILFFTLTGAGYHFLQLLHVAVLGFSGLWAMIGLWKGLQAMCEHSELYPKQAIRILQVWILVFAFVGLQMTWTLRPFIGKENLPFEIFRAHSEGNIYVTILHSAVNLARGVID
jgi:hypothetical protein